MIRMNTTVTNTLTTTTIDDVTRVSSTVCHHGRTYIKGGSVIRAANHGHIGTHEDEFLHEVDRTALQRRQFI